MSIDHIITVAITGLVGGAISFCWKKFTERIEKQQRETDALKKGLQSLLRYKIIDIYNQYDKQGWIPVYALQGLQAIYLAYEDLGENGVIDALMEHLKKLPNHPPVEVKENEFH
jgi:hypothetical protein